MRDLIWGFSVINYVVVVVVLTSLPSAYGRQVKHLFRTFLLRLETLFNLSRLREIKQEMKTI